MGAHAVAEGHHGPEGPEGCPAALARQEQAEESEEREQGAGAVVVQLEAVVTPVERAPLGARFFHGAVFLHIDVDKGTADEAARLFVLSIDVYADESGQDHLHEFFLVQAPAAGMAVVGVVAFATHGLRRGVQVRRDDLETAEGEAEG